MTERRLGGGRLLRIAAPEWQKLSPARLSLFYIGGSAFVVVLAALTLQGFRDAAESTAWVNHTYQVLYSLENTNSSVVQLENAAWGYLLTRDNSYKAGYETRKHEIDDGLATFENLTRDNPTQIRNIKKFSAEIKQKIVRLDFLVASPPSPATYRALLTPRNDFNLEIQDEAEQMKLEEQRLLAQRLSAVNFHKTVALIAFGATAVSAVLLLAGVFSLVLRLIRTFQETQRQQVSYNEQLEAEVDRTSAAQKELERSNRELQDFAFVASHDLQEPLRKIRSYGERLRSRLGDTLDATSITDIDRIQSAAERMQGLINDILALSRVTSKAQVFVSVDLNKVFDEVVDDLESRIGQTGAIVTRDDLPNVIADPVQMRQLIQNLIGNSLKFLRPDVQGTVAVTRMQTPPRGMIGFVVSDNGIGFEDKHAEKIFTVFQRLHNRTEYEGTGVGLAICRRIVERHRGYILATGTPGAGATFTVALPSTAKQEKSR